MMVRQYIIFLVLSLVSAFSGFAQREAYPTVVALQMGAGIAGSTWVPGGLLDEDTTRSLEATIRRGPVIMLSADHLFGARFSVGALIGAQTLSLSSRDSITKLNFESGTVNRYYVGLRGNWHYGKNPRIDMYSGFKIGSVIFKSGMVEYKHPGSSEIEEHNNRSRVAIGFTPFGVRFMASEEFGICLETSIGSPSFMSFGVNYRF
ncbi:MAG: hypothetical protein H6608_06475 [Flavobacteriales bacterium]|nr:hypothetical protein [Bacteroidota bacterium]MCB9240754.1 hypothetical protein [Flavobacteriales bacterium]